MKETKQGEYRIYELEPADVENHRRAAFKQAWEDLLSAQKRVEPYLGRVGLHSLIDLLKSEGK